MLNHFETAEYEFINAERVHIVNHHFGHNREGEMEVWIESGANGKSFMSQLTVRGEVLAVRQEVYTKQCYILRSRTTGRYWFLDQNACGFWLQNESFFGAQTFSAAAAVTIQEWLQEGGKANDTNSG